MSADVRPFLAEVPEAETVTDRSQGVPLTPPEHNALVMTHGWPGSVLEFLKAVGPLTDPVAYGGPCSAGTTRRTSPASTSCPRSPRRTRTRSAT
ncbi:hypothetical protein [Nonomuraea endophytica]|uniref:Alpha/beta hydrolase n=1 Tax=Nonomuraea endophytica TaxID=714136 RepID=A0A7W8EFX1_9ACTN|nr:hypothetical protein [Nonomuraea endophytica]MBB5077873.1 hypothetical protein [Nonomuraea endophytica]